MGSLRNLAGPMRPSFLLLALACVVLGWASADWTSGSVSVDGYDIVRDYRRTRSSIGLVPQELVTDAFETVWDTVSFGVREDPRSTDVYAFSCLAFEMLTGATLFSGDTLPVIITQHLTHEEGPESLHWLRRHRQAGGLGDLLALGLRRNPRRRISLSEMRASLAELGRKRLAALSWPLRN